MVTEAILLGTLLALGLACVVALARKRFRVILIPLVLALAVAGGWASIQYRTPPIPEEAVVGRPIEVLADDYVSSDTCRPCHIDEYDSWYASYHRTMTQVATAETVTGHFDDVTLQLFGRDYRLEQHGNELWASMYDPPGGPIEQAIRLERPIVMTTGSHHMQVYWFQTGDDRKLGQFPFVFLHESRRWIPRNSAFVMPPRKKASWEIGRWNIGCVKCHTTHGRPRVGELVPGRHPDLDTHVVEFGIACEACHGNAAEHVRENRDPRKRYGLYLGQGEDETIVNPQKLPHQRGSEVCGQCHSVFVFHDKPDMQDYFANGFNFRPGDDLHQAKKIHHSGDDAFWPDGTVRVAGREYNGLIASPCFQRGEMSCFSCHQMHKTADDPRTLEQWRDDQLQPGLDDDESCLRCHETYRALETLEAHTHHKAASSGSNCYNCHMPYTTYGLLKAIRNHTIDSPSVQESLDSGRPNACNQCHLDQTLDWAGDYLQQWYEIPRPAVYDEEKRVAASVLWLLRGDAAQRALMAWSMGWDDALKTSGEGWQAPYLATLLADPYDAVRYIAQRSLRRQPGFENFEYDFVGSAESLSDARVRALDLWEDGADLVELPNAEAILFDAQGTLDVGPFSTLYRQRDDSEVYLAE